MIPGEPGKASTPQEDAMGIFGKGPEGRPAESAAVPRVEHPRPAPAPGPAPAPAPRPGTAGQACVIGAKTAFKGEISGDEDILVEGSVEGEIRTTRDLRIGPGGVVKATVSAQSLIVSGEVVGDCEALTRVEIQSTGRLTGNIRAPKIVIAEGAMFRGNSDMSSRGKDERKDKLAIS
jgi:cytoskeletal protein CcmA (bactofilin family)